MKKKRIRINGEKEDIVHFSFSLVGWRKGREL